MKNTILAATTEQKLAMSEKYSSFLLCNGNLLRNDRAKEKRFFKWFRDCMERNYLPTLAEFRQAMIDA